MRNIDMRDLTILADLMDGKHTSGIHGKQAKDFKLDRAVCTIYKRLKHLEANGYVKRGFRLANAETFYITQEGIKIYEGALS